VGYTCSSDASASWDTLPLAHFKSVWVVEVRLLELRPPPRQRSHLPLPAQALLKVAHSSHA